MQPVRLLRAQVHAVRQSNARAQFAAEVFARRPPRDAQLHAALFTKRVPKQRKFPVIYTVHDDKIRPPVPSASIPRRVPSHRHRSHLCDQRLRSRLGLTDLTPRRETGEARRCAKSLDLANQELVEEIHRRPRARGRLFPRRAPVPPSPRRVGSLLRILSPHLRSRLFRPPKTRVKNRL